MQIEHAVPFAPEAEATVIGAMLMDAEAVPVGLEALKPSDFYDQRNRILFEAIGELFDRSAPTDPSSLGDHLMQTGRLDDIGGMAYLGDIMVSTPTAATIEYHAGVVRDRAVRRALIAAGRAIIADASAKDAEAAADKLDRASQRVFELAEGRVEGGPVDLRAAMRPAMADIESRSRSNGAPTGIPTGFADLDEMTGGIQRGDMWIIAARPSMGKTAIVTGITLHAAIEQQVGAAIFSLEMSKEQVVQRMLCHEALVDLGRMMRGRLRDDDYVRIAQAAGHLDRAPVWIDDRGSVSITAVRAAARRLKAQHPELGLIVVDYIQLMAGGDAENRQQEVSQISRGLKTMARELGVGVVALSQLSRKVEERPNKRPVLSDLRESGALEQDADLVGFVYRPERYMTPGEAEEKGVVGKAEFIVGKQRNGPTDTVELFFRRECARFESFTHREAA